MIFKFTRFLRLHIARVCSLAASNLSNFEHEVIQFDLPVEFTSSHTGKWVGLA